MRPGERTVANFYTWKNAISADWNVAADWSGNVPPSDPANDFVSLTVPGSYNVSIAAGESFAVASLLQTTGTLVLPGTLSIAGSSALGAGALIIGGGVLNGGGSLLSGGVIVGNDPASFLNIGMTSFNNGGTVQATGSGHVFIVSTNFNNLVGNTLTGGVYEVDGPAFGTSSSILINIGPGTVSEVFTDSATITLNGFSTSLAGWNGSAYVNIDASLSAVTAGGVLNILGGRGFINGKTISVAGTLTLGGGDFLVRTLVDTGTARGFGILEGSIANTGTVEAAGGVLTLTGALADTGTIIVDANAILALNGSFARPIQDDGQLQAEGGLLRIAGAVTGSGGFVIDSPTASTAGTLELAIASARPVAFNGPRGVLKLDAPASFTGSITGFGGGTFGGLAGDTIDLVGIVANSATLVGSSLQIRNAGSLVDTLTLAGNYTGLGIGFAAASDGAGGSAITVTGISARDYAFPDAYWHSKTITWSYATSNLSGELGPSFSHFFTTGTLPGDTRDQTQYQSVVQQALARWSAIAGFTFVQVADSANAGFRFGWGNLVGAGGEIGQASYNFQSDVMLADSIIRMQDPTNTPLDANAGVIGGLVYHNASSSLYQVALHEIGHSLGLGHSTDLTAAMYPTAGGVQNQDANASDIAGIQTLYAAVACFAAGTRIATGRGPVRVEALRPGDRVAGLVSGQSRRVRWIGQRHLDLVRHPRPHDVQPVRIAADAFGPGRPASDLRLSPDHALLIDAALIPVRYLVNGASIRQERVPRVTYFHVELEDADGSAVHDALAAEGLAVESYLDTGNRGAFATADAPLHLHPDFARAIWSAAGCAPLQIGGPAVATARRRLRQRAPALGYFITRDPDVHLVAAGKTLLAHDRNDHTWRFDAPAGTLRLCSRSAVPAEIDDTGDTRRLGIAIGRIALNGQVIQLDEPSLGAGFHPTERHDRRAWRWTDGAATLRLDRPGRLDITLALSQSYWRDTIPRQRQRA